MDSIANPSKSIGLSLCLALNTDGFLALRVKKPAATLKKISENTISVNEPPELGGNEDGNGRIGRGKNGAAGNGVRAYG